MRWTSGLFVAMALAICWQHDRLAGLGRRDDESALSLADRRDEVDDALGQLLGSRLEAQALLRVERSELAELDALRCILDRKAVDRVDLDERVVLLAAGLLALAGLLDRTDDGVALAQVVLLDLTERDVDVTRAGQVARRADEGVVVEHVEDAGDRDEDVVLADLGLELVARLAAALVALTVAGTAGSAVVVRVGNLGLRDGRALRVLVVGAGLRTLVVLSALCGALATLRAVAVAVAAPAPAAAGALGRALGVGFALGVSLGSSLGGSRLGGLSLGGVFGGDLGRALDSLGGLTLGGLDGLDNSLIGRSLSRRRPRPRPRPLRPRRALPARPQQRAPRPAARPCSWHGAARACAAAP